MDDTGATEWRVRGYSGSLEVYKLDLPGDRFSRQQVIEVLRVLAGRHLTGHEVSGAFLGTNDLLAVRIGDGPADSASLATGQNPRYVAGLSRKPLDQQ
jgi:hypothetical protein